MKHVISLWETGASWKTTCVEICDGERVGEREDMRGYEFKPCGLHALEKSPNESIIIMEITHKSQW